MPTTRPPPDDLTFTVRSGRARSESAPEARHALVVFDGDASFAHPLPAHGEVTIGRSPQAELPLSDPAASRAHAKITVTGDGALVSDLESRNGTRVNGEVLTGPRALVPGDAIAVCDTTLLYVREPRAVVERPLLRGPAFTRRLEEELERALAYVRPLTVLLARLPEGGRGHPRFADALGEVLRPFDVAGWVGPGELAVVLPEVAADERDALVTGITRRLAVVLPEARVGYATAPADGCDEAALLAGARAAALAAPSGGVVAASACPSSLDVGGRSIVVADPAMIKVYELVRRLAGSDLTVLVHGPTGAGKELVSRALHAWSKRAAGPFVAQNCAALPETLAESQLFGHERGAFTGAIAARAGVFEAAAGGTLFLDEIAELSPAVQGKLLRALESKTIVRVGDTHERHVDVRVVAATHRDLAAEVAAGRFREDLYYRIRAARITLPGLAARPRELAKLAHTFLDEACAEAKRAPLTLSAAALQALAAHPWPGNVRELRNAMQFVAATAPEDVVHVWNLPDEIVDLADGGGGAGADEGEGDAAAPHAAAPAARAPVRFRPLEEEIRELERSRIVAALEATGGVQTRAAELLGMPHRTFMTRIKQYGLSRRGAPKGAS